MRLEVFIIALLVWIDAVNLQINFDLLRLMMLLRAVDIDLRLVANRIEHVQTFIILFFIVTNGLLNAALRGARNSILLDPNYCFHRPLPFLRAYRINNCLSGYKFLFVLLNLVKASRLIHYGRSWRLADPSLLSHGFEVEPKPLWQKEVIDLDIHPNVVASQLAVADDPRCLLAELLIDDLHELVLDQGEEFVTLFL